MTLNSYAAKLRTTIFQDLVAGLEPSEGSYDEAVLKEARAQGKPQMGTTRYRAAAILFEYIYPGPSTSTTIVTVEVSPPERIVFMPVPDWVIENIWQGDVEGTFRFESEVHELLQAFERELGPQENQKWFEPQMAKRRE